MRHMMKNQPEKAGLRAGMTLIELLLSLVIVAMVLAGVSTLAFALSSVKNSTDDISIKQAYVRYAQTQLGDLMRHARLVCYASSDQVVFWTEDTNADGLMNISEMALLSTNNARSSISLTRFSAPGDPTAAISDVGDQAGQWWQGYGATSTSTAIVPSCSNATFATDAAAPNTRYVSMSFTIVQGGETLRFCVSGYLEARADHSLDSTGEIAADDD